MHASAVRRADTSSFQRTAVLPIRTSVALARSSLNGPRPPSHRDMISSFISRHFPPVQRGWDERAAPHSSYKWPAFQELFKSHRATPSLKSESVINRAPPNASEAKRVKAGVILRRRLCGMAALE